MKSESKEDSKGIYCNALAVRCSSTSADGLMGVTCHAGDKEKITDKFLSADWGRSFQWIWVKEMCIHH
jgi:hypothetical protein